MPEEGEKKRGRAGFSIERYSPDEKKDVKE